MFDPTPNQEFESTPSVPVAAAPSPKTIGEIRDGQCKFPVGVNADGEPIFPSLSRKLARGAATPIGIIPKKPE